MRTNRLATALGYSAMVTVTVGLFIVIRSQGERLVAPPLPSAGAYLLPAGSSNLFAQVLLALGVITAFARLVGGAFEKYLCQPPVMGEIAAGLLLGPSVLGAISTGAYEFLFPEAALPHLGTVANIGVVLFMFLVGLELNPRLLRTSSRATVIISHASILVPLLLGALLALGIYPLYSHSGISFTAFSLFVGVSMSVTAFPVLARILTDCEIQNTAIGATALACAAVDDATAWCLLAVVSSVATAEVSRVGWTVSLLLVYLALVLLIAKPILSMLTARAEVRSDAPSLTLLGVVVGILFFASAATETIGIHALFGAFLFGTVVPRNGRLAEGIRGCLEGIVVLFLLPLFFALTGMRTHLGLLSTASDWALCGVIILVATMGKFGGSFAAARLAGLGWRESSALGILMNTRGLMELIVLNVGLELGVLSPKLFAMLVLMALVTTFSTTPLLNLVMRRRQTPEAADVSLVLRVPPLNNEGLV